MLLSKTILSLLSLLALLLHAGCGSETRLSLRQTKHREVAPVQSAAPNYQQIVERIRGIVGKQLDLNGREVDVDLPLLKQKKPADELDVVEIVMNIEEAFSIEIKDEEIGESTRDVSKDLSVRKLADMVARKKAPK